jgi:hypothetical protein
MQHSGAGDSTEAMMAKGEARKVKGRLAGGMSLRGYCRARGVSPATLSKALTAGLVNRMPDGSVDTRSADAWLAARGSRHMRPRGAPAPGSVAAAQRRVLDYKAKIARLEYFTRKGELLEAAEVERAAFDMARRMRDLLQSMAPRLALVVAGLAGDQRACFAAVQAEADYICDEMSAKRARKGKMA